MEIKIKKVSEKNDFGALKQKIYDDFYGSGEKDLCFYVAPEIIITGKVLSLIQSKKQDIVVFSAVRSMKKDAEDGAVALVFLTEQIDLRRVLIVEDYFISVYVYSFETKHYSYRVISENKLDLMKYNLKGVEIIANDTLKIGEELRLRKKTRTLFIHSVEPYRRSLSASEFKKLCDKIIKGNKQLNSLCVKTKNLKYCSREITACYTVFMDHISQHYFKLYRHPAWFELLFFASLLSEFKGYPIHWLFIADAGTGKSKFLNTVLENSDEFDKIPIESSNSRIKGLVPSFYSVPVEMGALCRGIDFVCLDEFLDILMHTKHDEHSKNVLKSCNSLLEHQERKFTSGTGSVIAKCTSQVIACSNPLNENDKLFELCQEVDNSFLSRFMEYFQTADHIEYVKQRDYEVDDSVTCPELISAYEFLNLRDYLIKVKVKVNMETVRKCMNELQSLLTSDKNAQAFFKIRFMHHFMCILTGIIKLRCIADNDFTFTVSDNDYIITTYLLKKVIIGWLPVGNWKKIINVNEVKV